MRHRPWQEILVLNFKVLHYKSSDLGFASSQERSAWANAQSDQSLHCAFNRQLTKIDQAAWIAFWICENNGAGKFMAQISCAADISSTSAIIGELMI